MSMKPLRAGKHHLISVVFLSCAEQRLHLFLFETQALKKTVLNIFC